MLSMPHPNLLPLLTCVCQGLHLCACRLPGSALRHSRLASRKRICHGPNSSSPQRVILRGWCANTSAASLSGGIILKHVFCLIVQSSPSGIKFQSSTVMSGVIPHFLLVAFPSLYHFPSTSQINCTCQQILISGSASGEIQTKQFPWEDEYFSLLQSLSQNTHTQHTHTTHTQNPTFSHHW